MGMTKAELATTGLFLDLTAVLMRKDEMAIAEIGCQNGAFLGTPGSMVYGLHVDIEAKNGRHGSRFRWAHEWCMVWPSCRSSGKFCRQIHGVR